MLRCMHQSINQWFILLNNPIGFSKSGRRFAEPPAGQKTHILRLENRLITMVPPIMQYGATCNMLVFWWCEEAEETVEAAAAWSGKLGSELRHGTGKPMMVLYKDEGDYVVIAGVVVEECWSSSGKLSQWRHPIGRLQVSKSVLRRGNG